MNTGARWSIKQSKAKSLASEAAAPVLIVILVFGYKNNTSVDRRFGFVRRFEVTDAAYEDGAQLPNLIDPNNTANELFLMDHCKTSRILFRKPKGRPMSDRTRQSQDRSGRHRLQQGPSGFLRAKSDTGEVRLNLGAKEAPEWRGLTTRDLKWPGKNINILRRQKNPARRAPHELRLSQSRPSPRGILLA